MIYCDHFCSFSRENKAMFNENDFLEKNKTFCKYTESNLSFKNRTIKQPFKYLSSLVPDPKKESKTTCHRLSEKKRGKLFLYQHLYNCRTYNKDL